MLLKHKPNSTDFKDIIRADRKPLNENRACFNVPQSDEMANGNTNNWLRIY